MKKPLVAMAWVVAVALVVASWFVAAWVDATYWEPERLEVQR